MIMSVIKMLNEMAIEKYGAPERTEASRVIAVSWCAVR